MADSYVILGKFGAPRGLKGELKLRSFAHPNQRILDYQNWYVEQTPGQWVALTGLSIKAKGDKFFARIEGIQDCDQARAYVNKKIAVPEASLAPTEDNEYYWNDLIGLEVSNTQGVKFGEVEQLLSTGANDVLMIKSGKTETLIPFIDCVIIEVNLQEQTMLVDWEAI